MNREIRIRKFKKNNSKLLGKNTELELKLTSKLRMKLRKVLDYKSTRDEVFEVESNEDSNDSFNSNLSESQ